MKKSFSSNLELAKVWAKQEQYEAKGPSMFFKNQTLFSYGEHYELATFTEAPNGQQVIFVNDNFYSSTTRKHLGIALRVIPEGVYSFTVPFERCFYAYCQQRNDFFKLSNLQSIINRLKDRVATTLKTQSKARKNTWHFHNALKQINQINQICDLFKLEKIEKESILYYSEANAKFNQINKAEIDKGALMIDSLYEYFGG